MIDSGCSLKIRVNELDKGYEKDNSRMTPSLGLCGLNNGDEEDERSGFLDIGHLKWPFGIQAEMLSSWLDKRVWSS